MLRVGFHSGSVYEYDVAPEFHEAMAMAPSKGQFLWQYLRGKTPGRVIDAPWKWTPGGVGGSIVPYSKIAPRRISSREMKRVQKKFAKEIKRGTALKEVSEVKTQKTMGAPAKTISPGQRALIEKLEKRYSKDFVQDNVPVKGYWKTVNGKKVWVEEYERQGEAARKLMEKIKERGLQKTPFTEETGKKPSKKPKKQGLTPEERERKEIERQARGMPKGKAPDPREEAIQKLIEQTGYERARAEAIIDKQMGKKAPETPKKQAKKPQISPKKIAAKQQEIIKNIQKLSRLNQKSYKSAALRNLLQLMLTLTSKTKMASVAQIALFIQNVAAIHRDKQLTAKYKAQILANIEQLRTQINEMYAQGQDFIIQDTQKGKGWHGESERHSEAAKKGSSEKVKLRQEIKEAEEEVYLLSLALLGTSDPRKESPGIYDKLLKARAKLERLQLEIKMTPEQLKKMRAHYKMGPPVNEEEWEKDFIIQDSLESCVEWMMEKKGLEEEEAKKKCFGILRGARKKRLEREKEKEGTKVKEEKEKEEELERKRREAQEKLRKHKEQMEREQKVAEAKKKFEAWKTEREKLKKYTKADIIAEIEYKKQQAAFQKMIQNDIETAQRGIKSLKEHIKEYQQEMKNAVPIPKGAKIYNIEGKATTLFYEDKIKEIKKRINERKKELEKINVRLELDLPYKFTFKDEKLIFSKRSKYAADNKKWLKNVRDEYLKIPARFRDKNSPTIQLVDHCTGFFGRASKAGGTYSPHLRTINIATNPKYRVLYVDGSVVGHELGHDVYYQTVMGTPEVFNEWDDLYKKHKTEFPHTGDSYAATDIGECFAESFMEYATGQIWNHRKAQTMKRSGKTPITFSWDKPHPGTELPKSTNSETWGMMDDYPDIKDFFEKHLGPIRRRKS